MAQLEDFKPGREINGVLPNESVTVVDVQYHVETVPRAWHFTGDGDRFRLVAEAFRLR